MDLQECRQELDGIDRQLVELFERRMKICGAVAETKIASGKAVYDAEREKQKLEAVASMSHGDFNRTAVQELFSQIMTISRRLQYRLLAEHGQGVDLGFKKVERLPVDGARIVYQGVEGAYSHGAALQYFGENADMFHVELFEDAMKAVCGGQADFAVLPLENSSAGAVVDMYDLLSRYENYIVAEIFLPVNHALLGTADACEEQIRTVYSHPQALMQSSRYLNAHREWKQVSTENTAVAARKVLEDGDPSQAAVASEIAGKLYGLKVLKSAVQNNQGNTTRFVILSRQQIYRRDAGKISICFELPHRSGTLYNMLGHFIFNHVNMVMIESRPIPGRNWEYRFFVDIEGNLEDPAVENALKGIGAEALNMRILGNY
ncbi:MAG: bifunctional chorismate mutase/prephenate dehydratase [Eubacteriales bacterium]|nr:bifunctional chorismate mutase/prephenate dehydratase [Eubacteriales bacterium]